MTVLILPLEHAWFLWYSSLSCLLTIGGSIITGHYDVTVVSSSVLSTSLLYWSYPTYGFRRTLDMTVVQAGVWYMIWQAYGTPYALLYYGCIGLCMASYAGSLLLFRRGYIWPSTYLHSYVHIGGNIANAVYMMSVTP
jgi:hypothetical protein